MDAAGRGEAAARETAGKPAAAILRTLITIRKGYVDIRKGYADHIDLNMENYDMYNTRQCTRAHFAHNTPPCEAYTKYVH